MVNINSLSLKDEGGGEGGFKRDGVNNFLLLKKKRRELIRDGGSFEKGSFVDYLRYFKKFEPSEQGQYFLIFV